MIKKYFFWMLFFVFSTVNAQHFEWLQTFPITFNLNPSMIDYPSDVDVSNNLVLCGFKDTPVPYTDIFGNLELRKYSSAGELIFSKNILGEVKAYELVTDSTGNIYLAVLYLDAISVDNLSINIPTQGVHPLLLKFDSAGNLQWHKSIGNEWTNYFLAMEVDAADNLYIGYSDFQDSFVEKINPEGTSLQTITQNNVSLITSLSIDTLGNIYVAGSCADFNASFGGVIYQPMFSYTTYLSKYNPNGVVQWVKYVEDVTCPTPKVVSRGEDEVYFSSNLFDNFSIGGVATEGPVNGTNDFFLAKFNHNGDVQWIREVPGSGGVTPGKIKSLSIDNQGNCYFGGQTRGTIVWNTNTTTYTQSLYEDIILLKYDTSGNLIWAKTAGGNAYERVDSISAAADGSVFLTGMATQNIQFDEHQIVSSGFLYYPYLAKLDTTLLQNPTIDKDEIMLFPNPVSDVLTITFPDTESREVAVFNVLGQKIINANIHSSESIDVSSIPTGSYIVKINNGNPQKLIKN
ncbi:MAG TPA: T9SS type A sorting domain-containing protein [Flavobacterium lutivivi]|nr:T9SS type A sorting domain-containing protein [Flavobacterium lutivivi]